MSVRVLVGDMREVLPTLEAESFHACVTDPPYHFGSIVKRFAKTGGADRMHSRAEAYSRHAKGFMNKTWDAGDIAFQVETWAHVLRVLKPGAHLVAFGGTKGFHRMACAIEDAGFEIRDTLCWLYGSGFPKSHNQHGEWEGWGTALKPAFEPIILARKPLIGSVAANLEQYRTGALNIDVSRVTTDSDVDDPRLGGKGAWRTDKAAKNVYEGGFAGNDISSSELGRWPANVLHDGSDDALAHFPDSPGQLADASSSSSSRKTQHVYGAMKRGNGREGEASAGRRYSENGGTDFAALPGQRRGDEGSAARFFYCAKADRDERNIGMEASRKSRCSGRAASSRLERFRRLAQSARRRTIIPRSSLWH